MSESVKPIFVTFIKKTILLVLNSRMKEENEKEGTFSKLDLNRSGISNITSDSDFFDVDDLFIDEYDVLSFSKCQRKTFTIDFYVIFNYSCVEMNKLEIKVEYLSNDKVSHFFEGKYSKV